MFSYTIEENNIIVRDNNEIDVERYSIKDTHPYLYLNTYEGYFYIISKEHGLQELIPYHPNGNPQDKTEIYTALKAGNLKLVWEIKEASSISGNIINKNEERKECYQITKAELDNMKLKDKAEILEPLDLPSLVENYNKAEEITEPTSYSSTTKQKAEAVAGCSTLRPNQYRKNLFLKENQTQKPTEASDKTAFSSQKLVFEDDDNKESNRDEDVFTIPALPVAPETPFKLKRTTRMRNKTKKRVFSDNEEQPPLLSLDDQSPWTLAAADRKKRSETVQRTVSYDKTTYLI